MPVLFAGAGLKRRTLSRPVTRDDVAPTLAKVLGVKPPSGAMNTEMNRRRRCVRLSALTLALAVGLTVHVTASAQLADDNLSEMMETREIPVPIDNVARAASDIEFEKQG